MTPPLLNPPSKRERDAEYIRMIAGALAARIEQGLFCSEADAQEICKYALMISEEVTAYARAGKEKKNGRAVENSYWFAPADNS